MKNFKEFEVKNLDQITGGITIKIEASGIFDGIKKNEDFHISVQKDETGK